MRQSQSMRWEEAKGAWRPSVGWEREFGSWAFRYSPDVVDLGRQRVRSPYDVAQGMSSGVDRRVVVFLDSEGNTDTARLRGGYDPTTEPDLLRRFANLDFSQDSEIVRFYEDFGPLGVPDPDDLEPYGHEDWPSLGGEPVWWLKHKSAELRALTELYYGLQTRSTRRLRRLLGPVCMLEFGLPAPSPDAWVEDHMYRAGAGLPPSDNGFCPSLPRPANVKGGGFLVPRRMAGRFAKLTGRECTKWASYLVRTWVNRHLESVRRIVGWPQPQPWQKERAERAARPFVPQWYCHGLLGALYAHFYDIITGNGELRRCPNCGDLYPVPVVQRGRPKRYCTRRCQNAANKRAQRGTPVPSRVSRGSR